MIGKVSDEFFNRAIASLTGAPSDRVEVGPAIGVDAAILRTSDGFMAVAEDPIFPVPGLPNEAFGWFTVHIGASDIAVTGIKPSYMTYSLLVPPETPESDIEEIIRSIHEACRDLDITIVGGHTGFYPAVTVPIIGGVTVWGFGDRYISPAGSKVGDQVIMTKGAALEAAGILAQVFSDDLVGAGLPRDDVEEAGRLVYQMSVVEDCEVLTEIGGVNAMHDATEGGVWRGLYELATAADKGIVVFEENLFLAPKARMVCDHYKIDPYASISEGTLLASVEPGFVDKALDSLNQKGLKAERIGEIREPQEGLLIKSGSKARPLEVPQEDPFWDVFFSGLK